MAERLSVYVDGFNLYHGLHASAGTELLWLDLVALAQSVRPSSQIVKVKYFTATVLNEPHAQARQDRYIAALESLHPGVVEVIMGRYQEKDRYCKACKATWKSYEEKETDVNVAIHLVADVTSGLADTYMVISADSDVLPAIKMSRALNPSAVLTAQFPPRRSSKAIKIELPSSRQLTQAKVRAAQLPQLVIGKDGRQFERPEKWSPAATVATSAVAPAPTPPVSVGAQGHKCPTPAEVMGHLVKPKST